MKHLCESSHIHTGVRWEVFPRSETWGRTQHSTRWIESLTAFQTKQPTLFLVMAHILFILWPLPLSLSWSHLKNTVLTAFKYVETFYTASFFFFLAIVLVWKRFVSRWVSLADGANICKRDGKSARPLLFQNFRPICEQLTHRSDFLWRLISFIKRKVLRTCVKRTFLS